MGAIRGNPLNTTQERPAIRQTDCLRFQMIQDLLAKMLGNLNPRASGLNASGLAQAR